MEGLPKKKKGLLMIDVVFDIGNNGILSVSVVEMGVGGRTRLRSKGVVKGMAEDVDGGGWV